MGEPAVDIKDGLKETMEEVNRQMEDLKGPSEDEKDVEPRKTVSNDEVPLNVDEEIAAGAEESNEVKTAEKEINLSDESEEDKAVLADGQDDMVQEGDKEASSKETKEEEIPLDVDSLDEDELFDDEDIFLEEDESSSSVEEEGQKEPSVENREKTDDDDKGLQKDDFLLEKAEEKAIEDEVGIDISDDELWEDDAEEVSLFEEDVLNELSAEKEEKPEKKSEEDNFSVEEGEEKASEKKQEDIGENKKDAKKEVKEKRDILAFLPWVATGISSVLSALAIFTLWTLLQTPLPNAKPINGQKIPTSKKVSALGTSPGAGSNVSQGLSDLQAIDLAPFIIPGKSGGELVFFKLRVELLVPNAKTKQEILKKQAWVRDIIYQELKGIDISSGLKGDVLQRFRRPILDKLNRELSPVKVSDVRLMGYLLR